MPDVGTIDKSKIVKLVKKNTLITKGFREDGLKEACYLSHTSNEFFEIKDDSRLVNVSNDNYFILKPNNSVVCKTAERFQIPTNMIARVLLTGHYFSIGISPVNTYADPGFDGHLGIILTNTSKNYIKIYPNVALAKIEFAYINGESDPYVGQHGGDLTTWPLRNDLILSEGELSDKNIDVNSISEVKEVHGLAIANMIDDLQKSRKYLYIFTAICAALPIIIIWGIQSSFDLSSPFLSAIVGVGSGLIANYIFKLSTK